MCDAGRGLSHPALEGSISPGITTPASHAEQTTELVAEIHWERKRKSTRSEDSDDAEDSESPMARIVQIGYLSDLDALTEKRQFPTSSSPPHTIPSDLQPSLPLPEFIPEVVATGVDPPEATDPGYSPGTTTFGWSEEEMNANWPHELVIGNKPNIAEWILDCEQGLPSSPAPPLRATNETSPPIGKLLNLHLLSEASNKESGSLSSSYSERSDAGRSSSPSVQQEEIPAQASTKPPPVSNVDHILSPSPSSAPSTRDSQSSTDGHTEESYLQEHQEHKDSVGSLAVVTCVHVPPSTSGFSGTRDNLFAAGRAQLSKHLFYSLPALVPSPNLRPPLNISPTRIKRSLEDVLLPVRHLLVKERLSLAEPKPLLTIQRRWSNMQFHIWVKRSMNLLRMAG